jgi:single-strand DNA-binding protein
MAGSYNKITIIGYVARDPEMRYTTSGDAVTDFSIPVSERRKDGQEITTWFRISAFGKLAETCNQYLHKGSYVYIEGSLTQRDWTDRDGATRTSLDVRAREMRMLDKAGDVGPMGSDSGDFGAPARAGSSAGPADAEPDMDNIPF